MQIPFLKLSKASVAVIAVTVLFVISLFLGLFKGFAAANAKSVYNTVLELETGLNIFFQDQDRFPSLEEFSDRNVLLTYFSRLPDNVSKNSTCKTNYNYTRLSAKNYWLDFCLPVGLGRHQKGWNRIIGQNN